MKRKVYPIAEKRIRQRGQSKLIRDTILTMRDVRKLPPDFYAGEKLLHILRRLEGIKQSLVAWRYIKIKKDNYNG